jgi:hypothetical protein
MEIIDEKFSECYESINDSDGSSEDLGEVETQYLMECIKNNGNGKGEEEEKDGA